MTDQQQTPEQQERERKARLEEGKRLFNEQLHHPANRVTATRETTRDELNQAIRVTATRETTRDELNQAIRRAAGRGTTDEGDGAA